MHPLSSCQPYNRPCSSHLVCEVQWVHPQQLWHHCRTVNVSICPGSTCRFNPGSCLQSQFWWCWTGPQAISHSYLMTHAPLNPRFVLYQSAEVLPGAIHQPQETEPFPEDLVKSEGGGIWMGTIWWRGSLFCYSCSRQAGRSAGHTTRTKASCNVVPAAETGELCLPASPDRAAHSWGQSQSLTWPSGRI